MSFCPRTTSATIPSIRITKQLLTYTAQHVGFFVTLGWYIPPGRPGCEMDGQDVVVVAGERQD